jgi:hypothetical protein
LARQAGQPLQLADGAEERVGRRRVRVDQPVQAETVL